MSNQANRIVITGMGTINAIAANIPDFMRALQEGTCGIGPVDLFDTAGCRSMNGGQIRDFNPHRFISPSYSLKRMSRADLLAFAATLEALHDAGLYPLPSERLEDMGIAMGGGSGGLLEAEGFYGDVLKKGSSRARFSKLTSIYCTSSTDCIASHLGLMGPKITLMTACSAGATVLGYGRDLIRSGQAAMMLAGGVEPMCRITYAAAAFPWAKRRPSWSWNHWSRPLRGAPGFTGKSWVTASPAMPIT